jgi:hypothetical protein
MREQTGSFRQPHPLAVDASPTAGVAGWFGRPLVRGGAIALIGGLFLALSGAFGTSQVPLAGRATYWIGLLEFGTLLNAGFDALVGRSRTVASRPMIFTIVSFLALTLVLTPIVVTITGWAYGWSNGPAHFAYIAVAVAIISAVMTSVNMLAERQPLRTHAAPLAEPPLATSETPAILDTPHAPFEARLPSKLRGASLYAVEAQDHYLRLHTSRGSDLILMRLSDALAELKGIEGAQVHRSWWVARNAVIETKRAEGRAIIILPSGAEAPVSRTYVKALREAGWL